MMPYMSGLLDPFTECASVGTLARKSGFGKSVRQTRILIANAPRILQDMIAAIISSEPRFRVVEKLTKQSDIVSAIRRTQADVVVLYEEREVKSNYEVLLVCRCFVKALAISESGREAAIYQLRLQRTPLGEISGDGLISAIDRALNS
jgi:hypothetical protein